MIEVIKHGTKGEAKCKHCGCVFSYEEEDIKYEHSEGAFRISGKYIPCPDCGKAVYIMQTREPIPPASFKSG